jgi:glycosyltransferase involved in cell wall biosynthesis
MTCETYPALPVKPKQSSTRAEVSVCIVSHNAYSTFSGSGKGHFGGVEWQTSVLARWLAGHGCNVSLLTWDEGGPPVETLEGIKVIKIAPPDAGLPGLRFFHPKWTGLVRAMRSADADVYYHNCCECVTGQVAHWCQRHAKKFVYSCASDAACETNLPGLKTGRDRMFYRYGLRRADVRIVQTTAQQEKLRRNFGVDAVVIPMPYAASGETKPAAPSNQRVLWLGRVCHVKRPDRLVDLATACPEIRFDMVGPVYSDEYARAVDQRAKQTPNITAHGQVGRERAASLYAAAACLCCTSEYEGFPNTFLEAWAHGLPVVSTFDPDGVIQRKNLGRVVRTVSEMAEAIRELRASPAVWREISENARRYVHETHRAEIVLPKFEQVLRDQANASHRQSLP